MKQSKIESGIEITCNYVTGFIIAWLTFAYIVIPSTWLKESPFWITVLFTAISIARSFFWRRFFNAELHKVVHKILNKIIRSK